MEISTDVVYTIHLGGVEGVDDYNLLRNTYYTYNVKIVSVDKIIIEVDSSKKTEEDERRPGAEGDVVMALQIKELDAYNEVFTLSFHQSNVDETMTWDVNTPFSRGAAGEHPADYKWIKFRINSKNSSKDNRNVPTGNAFKWGSLLAMASAAVIALVILPKSPDPDTPKNIADVSAIDDWAYVLTESNDSELDSDLSGFKSDLNEFGDSLVSLDDFADELGTEEIEDAIDQLYSDSASFLDS